MPSSRSKGAVLRAAALAPALALALIAACADDSGVVTEPEPGPQGQVSIAPSDAVLAIDSTVHFFATVIDSAGNVVEDAILSWVSSDRAVATVDSTGLVQGGGQGSARIRVVWEGLAAEAEVHVAIRFVFVSGGGYHTCGITADSLAFCWGDNQYGQLGNARFGGGTTKPVRVSGELTFASLSAGLNHTCGITVGGQAYCWGDNQSGQLGFGLMENANLPTPVAGRLPFAALSAGSLHTCGFTRLGFAYCWGSNESGRLGDGTTVARPIPTAVTGNLLYRSISAGNQHTCGVTIDNRAYCWGDNESGQLGRGDVGGASSVPVAVSGDLTFSSVSAGRAHTCGNEDDRFFCWGDDTFGQLGSDSVSGIVPVPVRAIDRTLTHYDAGGDHLCGWIYGNPKLFCWGRNEFGQLGIGNTEDLGVPTALSDRRDMDWYTAGRFHSCGIARGWRRPEGIAYCWGRGSEGQLGDGDTVNRTSPVRVAGQL